MRAIVLAFAALVLVAGCKKQGPEGPVVSPTFDERQACGGDADCAVVEIECCDHCNGGSAVGVHKDHAKDVKKEYVAEGECAGTACTLMACPEAEPICREGRCGVKVGGTESLPELPRP
jgi:hypothetical protein